jgi:hypothetical protein
LSLVGVALLFGCGGPPLRSELCGVYFAQHDNAASEKVVLHCDGSFEQTVTQKRSGGTPIVARGKWNYDEAKGYITFDHSFVVLPDELSQANSTPVPSTSGIVIEPVEKWFGRVRFGTSEGILYRKRR